MTLCFFSLLCPSQKWSLRQASIHQWSLDDMHSLTSLPVYLPLKAVDVPLDPGEQRCLSQDFPMAISHENLPRIQLINMSRCLLDGQDCVTRLQGVASSGFLLWLP